MTIETLSKNNVPLWAANIIIVFGFLGYMEIQTRRGDLVADQRIKHCHAVQEEGILVMRSLRDSMINYTAQCAGLSDAIETLSQDMDDLRDQMRKMPNDH